MKTVTKICKALPFAAALAFASVASAEEAPSSLDDGSTADVLSAEDLDALAGGTGVDVNVLIEQTLAAVNSGNTVSGEVVSSGELNIGANAFSGYSGLGNFVINTGHNNNLQSSMNVSIVLAPPAAP